MIIIDFDDTLFDAQGFKELRLQACEALGVSVKDYTETYQMARKDHAGVFGYSNESHAEELEKLGYPYEDVLHALHNTCAKKQMQELILDGAKEFLTYAKESHSPVILVSLGEDQFQQMKIERTELSEFFDEVHIVQSDKVKVIQRVADVYDHFPFWFVNDKLEETLEIAKAFEGNIRPIIKRPDGKHETYEGIPVCKTFKEVRDYIEKTI